MKALAKRIAAVATGATVLCALPAAAGPSTYQMIVIEPFDTSYSLATSRVGDMNSAGVAVGIAHDDGTFFWDEVNGKVAADIGGGEINESGVTAAGGGIWFSPGEPQLIPHPTQPTTNVNILDLNDENWVCGFAGVSERTIGFVWDEARGSRTLESLGVPTISRKAVAVNNAGLLVGVTSAAGENFDEKAFLLDVETQEFTDLHTMLNPLGDGATHVADINELGVVIGEGSYDDVAGVAAFTWSENQGFTLLPPLSGGLERNVHPKAINDAGTVVGEALLYEDGWDWKAFIWDATNGIRDLETMTEVPEGFNVQGATGVTSEGWIFGHGFWGTAWGPERAFVLIPSSDATVAAPEAAPASTLSLSVASPAHRADIRFELPRAAHATIRVFDARGREVARPLDETRPAGSHSVTWNPGAPAGLYFVRLDAASDAEVRRFVRIR